VGPGGGAEVGRKTTGHKVVIAVALALLVGGSVGGILSCCWPRRLAPSDPDLWAIPFPEHSPVTVRVLLEPSAESFVLEADSPGTWEPVGDAGHWERPVQPGSYVVGAAGDRLALDGEALPSPAAVFTPQDGMFRLGGATYRGRLLVEMDPDGRLRAIEEVGLEDYVRGVVPAEMPSGWPLAALMAQAVAVRTFAGCRLSPRGHGRPYLTSIDMAYGGVSAESRRTDDAVARTAGIVLAWQGEVFPAYFHSCCGGYTCSPLIVWGEPAVPPLRGGECGWCEASPHYEWSARVGSSKLASMLAGRGIIRVRSIATVDPGPSGRPAGVLINGTERLPADAFRLAVGSRLLKSAAYAVTRQGDDFEFAGKGWGHGVGLCQWGARGMALEGYAWSEILAHYYPGAELATAGAGR